MANFPHSFPNLRNGPRFPFLIVGAGLSWDLVPLPNKLLKDRKDHAEQTLGCGPFDIDLADPRALYIWAQQVINRLAGVAASKLQLAQALGLLTDPYWTAGVGIPLRGTTPRHRVIARFVREKRWASVWSLNWDTHLENALERIGFERGGRARPGQPWQTQYHSVLTLDDFYLVGDRDYFCIYKPHGCVRSLQLANEQFEAGNIAQAELLSERFMITDDELTQQRPNPTNSQFFSELRTALGQRPLIVLGWSISEPYLHGAINETIVERLTRGVPEELTVIDVAFNDKGHKAVAEYYALTPEQCFMELERPPGIGCNEFFLWLQAKYALDCLLPHAGAAASSAIARAATTIDRPIAEHYLLSWTDDFLPAWTRLCWRSDLVRCAGFQSHELRLEEKDFHIPWHVQGLPRPDLTAASNILAVIRTEGFDFSKFPGGAWDDRNGRLIVPMPAWGNISDLAALKPLVAAIKDHLGFVQQIDILPVSLDPDDVITNDIVAELKEQLTSLMPVLRFSRAGSIGTAVELREV